MVKFFEDPFKIALLIMATLLLLCYLYKDKLKAYVAASNQQRLEEISNPEVVIIDSCEYIYIYSPHFFGGERTYTHKANCKNPIHQK